MPIDVYWYNAEQNILMIKVVGQWTWEDYAVTNKTISAMTSLIKHPYDSIADMTEAPTMPNGKMMESIGQGINTYPPNFRLSLFVRPPNVFKSVLTVLNTTMPTYPKRIFADTVEEALSIIANYSQNA